MPVHDDIALRCSPFLAQLCARHPGWLAALRESGRLEQDAPPRREDLEARIASDGLDAGLRRFRNHEMLRITWRELNRVARAEQTMADLSLLAELCLDAGLAHLDAALAERHGVPRDANGQRVSLVVLGLGKLGGGELNLSSDIDLVFCYPRAGECDGRRRLSANEYFTRQVRALIRCLSEITADGFCFRVDARLRPFGDSGPLVSSFGAMEQYYQRDGRDWERYALVKARPVGGDRAAGDELLAHLAPFVYRRYIDFGAVEALREMLDAIRDDAARHGREQDIKRGPGGIREIEFLVQCLQLLRGGRDPGLQSTSLLAALGHAGRTGLFPPDRAAALGQDYLFLRRCENAIQALHDRQTHELPEGDDLHRVALAMRCAEPGVLLQELSEVRARVSAALLESFPEQPDPAGSARPWPEILDGLPAIDGKPMDDFRARLGRVSLSPKADDRLQRFMPMLLQRMAALDLPAAVQNDVLELVLAVCRRSAYLSLLVENPPALARMLELFAASGWIAGSVIRHPALLDELIDPALGRALPEEAELATNVQRILAQHDDNEAAVEALNYVKLSTGLRIAVAELEGTLATPGAQRALSILATRLLEGCRALAARLLAARHGEVAQSGLGVIAYGTLGAREMGHTSDLDIIFLYRPGSATSDGPRPLGTERYFTRLARRLLGLTTALTPAGRLYEIDTRLRPNGRAGMLVSSLDAFARYQHEEAWSWELQALVRARAVAGDAEAGQAFKAIRAEVLCRPRETGKMRDDVRDMRRRMRAEFTAGDPFKHARGGLVDIDFVAQLGVLECAPAHPGLLDHTGSTALLEALATVGWLGEDAARILIDTHLALSRGRHLAALSRAGHGEPPDTADSWAICRSYLE